MGLGSLFRRGKKESKEEAVEQCHIDINTDECGGCEKCATACPNNVLLMTALQLTDVFTDSVDKTSIL